MLNLVVFASGNGSTLQAIIDAINNNELSATINLVVSNNKDAFALERAKKNNIDTYIIGNKEFQSQDEELYEVLSNYKIDLIVLAGYLKMIGPKLLNKYTIINTHPSLLPKYGGKGMYGMKVHKAVVEAGEKISGVTLHYVNSEYDKGSIIAQTKVDVLPTDTAEDVSAKVQAVEKIQLVNELKKFSLKFSRI
ncbi:MAG TPA: phosphoribosylglycinamide formyltransferase [Clostridiales bacterium]|nr:phosphoribosylglycinamide formyltransferase [Clostridiales bacterium]